MWKPTLFVVHSFCRKHCLHGCELPDLNHQGEVLSAWKICKQQS